MHCVEKFIDSFDFHHFSCLESTNMTAKDFATKSTTFLNKGIVHVFYTDEQTVGYGKANRTWCMKVGNVAVSFLWIDPEVNSVDITQLTFVMSLSIGKTFESFGIPKENIQYKWPNDILISGKKISGVLLESSFSGFKGNQKTPYIVAGVGINIQQAPDKESVVFPATSLKEEGYETPTAIRFIEKLSLYVKRYYNIWQDKGFKIIRDSWLENAWCKEGTIIIKTNDKKKLEGKFLGLQEDGALLIQCEKKNEIYTFYSADVFKT